MGIITDGLSCLLDFLAPETCVVCGATRVSGQWAEGIPGPAPGLSPWHAPHCCSTCLDRWLDEPRQGVVEGYPLWSTLLETRDLVRAVGWWKYQGVRGLGRPLAAVLVQALEAAVAAHGPALLIPAPLHPGRRRERGFDQTLQLATLAGRATGLVVLGDVLVRHRATAQQAMAEVTHGRRQGEVAGAFRARSPEPGEPTQVALLDDLATTGATLGSAAGALSDAGWEVVWFASLGQASRLVECHRT